MNPGKILLSLVSASGLALGFAAGWAGRSGWAEAIWGGAAVIVLAVLLIQILKSLGRGEFGLDIVAALSMSAAIAFGETLAAAVVALMYAGGQLLEDYAANRATRRHEGAAGPRAQDGAALSRRRTSRRWHRCLRPGDRILCARATSCRSMDGFRRAGHCSTWRR